MAGSGKGKGKGPAVATGAIMGGFLCLGLIMTGIAATIVLSLISIYTSNNSKQGNGDYYRIKAYGLKGLFSGTSNTFGKGSVAESTGLSSLCASMYAKSSTAKNLAGCVATGFTATSVNNSNTSRRRRQTVESAIALVGEIRIYYSNTCGQTSDTGKATNSSSVSSCVKARLAECNALYNSNGTLTQWSPLSGLSLTIVANNSNAYTTITLSRLYALSQAQTADYVNKAFGNTTAQSMAFEGCIYGGPISVDALASALSAQSSATTTQPTTTAASG